MRTRRQKLLDDRQAILGQSNADENSSPIPKDLIYEIFFRLPSKYTRCRCVSKLWSTILASQAFTDEFLKRSSTRPQLLFACQKNGKVSFFSSPQPQSPDENTSPVTASYLMSLQFNGVYHIPRSISGWVCIGNVHALNERNTLECVICNPSTGQSFTLPKMKTRKRRGMRSFFGYDPIEKQLKVLSMAWLQGKDDAVCEEHQVLTLETGKLSWRVIECNIPHYPEYDSVCIDGGLYYKATPNRSFSSIMIICFDVRSEKFSFIKATEEAVRHEATLINFNGKFASLTPNGSYCFCGACTSFDIWVLDDPEENEWSKHSYKLPPQWKSVVPNNCVLKFVGVTGANEIVFSEQNGPSSKPFYVFYYSLEKETIRRVEIQGMGAFVKHGVYTFLNHVEDVRLMKVMCCIFAWF